MRLSDLTPNPNNPRTITDEKLKMLKKSIERFGSLDGIIYNRRTKRLCGGHQRQKIDPSAEIVIELEHKEPTKLGTVAEGSVVMFGEKFPYREVDWDEDTEKAANIAANKGGGEWDFPQLGEWFNELDLKGFDLDLTMFDQTERDRLKPQITQVEGQCDPDEVPEAPKEPRTKLGDIYELGNHRVMCGDSTSIDAVEGLMDGAKADMVFTDPPYGMNAVSKDGKVGGGTKHAPAKTYRPVLGDEDTTVAKDCFNLFSALEIPKMIIWGGNYFTDFLPPSPCWIVWDKQRPEGLTFADGEVAWTNFSTPLKFIRHRWDGYHRASERDQARVHPTQKPAALAEWCFNEYGSKDDKVLDLFGGSGSTLIACERTGRTCYMMEVDPHYCDVIVSRYVKFTGNNKIKLNGEPIEWTP